MTVAPEREPLPRIFRFLGVDDAPGSSCPRCGATGRFIYRFQVADGRWLAAMRGCVQLFPVSPVAPEHARLLKKSTDYAERGWHLNRGDAAALDAIQAFCDGRLDEHTALATIRGAKEANALRARARRAPLRCVTRRRKEVLRNVMRQHPSWYRADGMANALHWRACLVPSSSSVMRGADKRAKPTRPTSTVLPHACWRC